MRLYNCEVAFFDMCIRTHESRSAKRAGTSAQSLTNSREQFAYRIAKQIYCLHISAQ